MSQLTNMINALDRILAWLSRNGRAAATKLQPGLTPAYIAAEESKLPFALPRELETMYQWRNGTEVNEGDLLGQAYLFPGFYLLSLDEALQTYSELKGSSQWKKHWFPIFANGGGDFYVVPCEQNKVDSAEVIGFIHGEPDQTVEYESVTAMLETLAGCYDNGAFYIDDDELELDDDKHRVVAHRFNPGVEEWQD